MESSIRYSPDVVIQRFRKRRFSLFCRTPRRSSCLSEPVSSVAKSPPVAPRIVHCGSARDEARSCPPRSCRALPPAAHRRMPTTPIYTVHQEFMPYLRRNLHVEPILWRHGRRSFMRAHTRRSAASSTIRRETPAWSQCAAGAPLISSCRIDEQERAKQKTRPGHQGCV